MHCIHRVFIHVQVYSDVQNITAFKNWNVTDFHVISSAILFSPSNTYVFQLFKIILLESSKIGFLSLVL